LPFSYGEDLEAGILQQDIVCLHQLKTHMIVLEEGVNIPIVDHNRAIVSRL